MNGERFVILALRNWEGIVCICPQSNKMARTFDNIKGRIGNYNGDLLQPAKVDDKRVVSSVDLLSVEWPSLLGQLNPPWWLLTSAPGTSKRPPQDLPPYKFLHSPIYPVTVFSGRIFSTREQTRLTDLTRVYHL